MKVDRNSLIYSLAVRSIIIIGYHSIMAKSVIISKL